MIVKLPKELKGNDRIVLQFRFESEKKELFGDILIGIIDFNSLAIYEEEDRLVRNSNAESVKKVKGDKEGGSADITKIPKNETLYEYASLLSDRGCGDFD